MKRSLLFSMCAAPALLSACLGSSSAQAAPTLPTPDCGTDANNNCLVFDDFTVYSLALLNYKATGNPLGPNEPFQVDSSGNAIAEALVIASHPANAIKNQHLFATDKKGVGTTVDNAYDTPNNVASGFANFLMTALGGGDGAQDDNSNSGADYTNSKKGAQYTNGFLGDNVRMGDTLIANNNAPGVLPSGPGGTIADGSLPLWDITIAGLNAYLGGDSLVFYFNLNEENGGTLDSGQDMLAYADVYLTDFGANGVPGGGDDTVKKYTLSGNYCSYGLFCPTLSQAQTAGVDDILPDDPTDTPDGGSTVDKWAYVHGEICVDDDGALLALGPCTGEGNTINQNLGANTAAFGVYSAELDNDVKTGAWDIMSVDLRMGHIGNGYDQLFILPTKVPEPGTLAMAGLGLFGLYRLRRRQRPGHTG